MLKLYNTLTRKKEQFKPISENQISFYHCGPTVYWTQHIGNMRAVVLADLIKRSLEYLDYEIKLVRNYTDVGHLTSNDDEGEDKLEKGAKREKTTPQEVANKYIKIFEQDINDLNTKSADVKPRATEHIKEMREMIQTLLDKKFAYQTELAIYFNVSKAKNYTKLSGQNLEKNIADAGGGEVSDPEKKNPADFALWFFKTGKHENAMQTWDSTWGSPNHPIGQGFPGWHIECSAMSKKYLGETIDVHMGGIEHIPVHHTNEIAQSESANGKKLANYWLHNEHLTVNNKKMAKSEGTAYSVQEIKDKGYDPLVLRYFFLNAHYRSKQNFTWEALNASKISLKKLQDKILEIKNSVAEINFDVLPNEKYRKQFITAIEDDFNIPQALAIIWEIIKDDKLVNEERLTTILDFDKVLGLKLAELKPVKIEVLQEVRALIDNRQKFRDLGDFEEADNLRKEIEKQGYLIEDTPDGVKVRKK
ncbi:MAG: cysteine--tRNA ligase [Candidatus Falkowbacteria bacterium]